MPAFIALLRAVNIGGRWIKMAELRDLFAELGFADAQTYVQSGNVVFTTNEKPAAVKAKIEKAIADRFGFHAETILRTHGDLVALITGNPFPAMAEDDPAHLLVHFTAAPFGTADHAALAMKWAGPETWTFVDPDLFISYPGGIGRSELKLKLKTPTTARNWKSVLALAAMAEARNSQAGAPQVKSPRAESARAGRNGEEAMAKGQQKPNKEKRKPKSDKNKPKKGTTPMPMSTSAAGAKKS